MYVFNDVVDMMLLCVMHGCVVGLFVYKYRNDSRSSVHQQKNDYQMPD